MLKLTVTAPGKHKVELECQPSDTFADVKVGVQQALGVPPDKQRLLCNGKERKDAKETLVAAGITAKSKLMLMLVPGYTMPAMPAADSVDVSPATASANDGVAAPTPDVEGELPVPDGVVACADGAVVHVRQGSRRFHVKVPQGLAAATFGELADYLASELLVPKGTPSTELRFICRGKTAAREELLNAKGGAELSVMLLFAENFHLAAEGAEWLRERSAELSEAEASIEKIGKRVEANLCDAETSVRLTEVCALVETLSQSMESVRVNETLIPEMEKLRDRVLSLEATLPKLRKSLRL
mmetsp:Transcript_123058/g.244955  ORF Transcript_123058/g.244955 Transcript_123058/m.244955 type:complete len:299 (-) Transcript_123058:45-941(-)